MDLESFVAIYGDFHRYIKQLGDPRTQVPGVAWVSKGSDASIVQLMAVVSRRHFRVSNNLVAAAIAPTGAHLIPFSANMVVSEVMSKK